MVDHRAATLSFLGGDWPFREDIKVQGVGGQDTTEAKERRTTSRVRRLSVAASNPNALHSLHNLRRSATYAFNRKMGSRGGVAPFPATVPAADTPTRETVVSFAPG